MKDITTAEAVEKIKEFIKILKCFESNCNLNNFVLPYALEKVLNELEKYKELYISTLGRSLNNCITQSNKEKDNLEALNEGWKIKLEKKDKIINAMALQLSGISIWDDQKEEPLILMTEEEVKQYFERIVENE